MKGESLLDKINSDILVTILTFKYAIEYEKTMLEKYYEYKKRVTLSSIKDIIIKVEADSYKRMKLLDDIIKKLNLKQMNQSIDTFDDIEAMQELVRYQATGYNMYNDFILKVRNPLAKDAFKELREGIFEYINMLEINITKLKSIPVIDQEVYPVK